MASLIELPDFVDDRGQLVVLDSPLPFPVRRVFWINAGPDDLRGGHRHVKCHQLLYAVTGSVSVYVDNSQVQNTFLLSQSNIGLLLDPSDWHTMRFESAATLLVLASHRYDPSDYVHDPYPKF